MNYRKPSGLLALLLFFIYLIAPLQTAASVEHFDVYSESMDRTLPIAVVLPVSYHENELSHPVIYLLHGATDNYQGWLIHATEENLVQQLADQYGVIFVLPSGDNFSFYFDGPENPKSQFETHITREVIPFVDANFRTIADKRGRAITGLSMGGHGALYLATRNPELFAAAGSMSGSVDLDISRWGLEEVSVDLLRQLLEAMDNDSITADFLSAHSVTNLVNDMKENNMPLIIDCGVDDFLLDANRLLNSLLQEAGVPHDYIERPGEHNWAYWTNALLYQVLFITEVFER